ncbi:MAG: hypothetical protein HYZ75_06090 [Elusimicrobia bacterium]|nr:hypothetical protein [Elusimicrobiota bacterium]
MRDTEGTCWKCGRALTRGEYGRQEVCPGCAADTRVCRNCLFYDKSMDNECREPAAERVLDKEKGNFCEYFKPGTPKAVGVSPKEVSAKDAFEKLFKKKP